MGGGCGNEDLLKQARNRKEKTDHKGKDRLDHIRYLNVYMVGDPINKSRDNRREEKYLLHTDKSFMSCIPLKTSHMEFLQTHWKSQTIEKWTKPLHRRGNAIMRKADHLPICWGNANKSINKIPFSTKH